ncbi:MAG: hypothetical protein HPY50_14395 [Firmicutes bacterium]|nr:hypothetical protein [Bacillota bacterium]
MSRKTGFGEWLDWDFCNWIFDTGNTATITDIETGKQFKVKRYGGSSHADCEPLTAADTQIMKEIFGGSWSWERRAVVVNVGDRYLAASMNGMPHGDESITGNDFDGQFCVHFLNSKNHNTNQVDAQHQAMVQKAAGY